MRAIVRFRIVIAAMVVATLAALFAHPGAAQRRSPAPSAAPASPSSPSSDVPKAFAALLTDLSDASRARDSLTSLADTASGEARTLLEEQIWQRHEEFHAELLAAAEHVIEMQGQGADASALERALASAVGWPRYLGHIQRAERNLMALRRNAELASGAERVALESKQTLHSERIVSAYEALVTALRPLERAHADVGGVRAFLLQRLPQAAQDLVTRVRLAKRDQAGAAQRLAREASSADARYAFEASDEQLKRATQNLSTAIRLMGLLGLETTALRVALIESTGKITTDVFRWNVLVGLLQLLGGRLLEFLAGKAPQWLFQGLLVVLTFLGFRALSRVARTALRRALEHSQMSRLMRSTAVRLSGHGVMLVGFLIILTQLGVQIAPLLAGLGIVGFVLGFAMQNTLSNFAAGGMILGNQPFDVGDEIEVAGVQGTVKRMTLVSTTILTADNQTLIVPNSTVWGGVIRNRTTQPVRRVDLTFQVSYRDDIAKAERVLREIVAAQEFVLKEPPPTIKLDRLADSAVVWVVRIWTPKEKHADVSWDVTRAVKLRFDQEGFQVPFPQRELHVNLGKGGPEGPLATRDTAPPDP